MRPFYLSLLTDKKSRLLINHTSTQINEDCAV